MSSIKAIKHAHAATSKTITTAGVWLKAIVVSPFTGATGKLAVCESTTKAATFVRVTTTATITSAGHGLATGDFVWLDWPLGDGVYEVTFLTDDTYSVTVADAGDANGNVTGYYKVVFQVDMSDPVVFQVTIPEPGLPSEGLFLGLPSDVHASVLYSHAQ